MVFARLNEITPARHVRAPASARLAEDTEFAGKLISKAGDTDEAIHMSAAAIAPSATGGSFNSRPPRSCFSAGAAPCDRSGMAAVLDQVAVLAVGIP